MLVSKDVKRRIIVKTIIINTSPRKNWNTERLLKEAQKGAESAGGETEYVDLYDLSFTGCRSCLACKRKDAQRNRCYWEDDLSPLIGNILEADNLIIGSPIYFGEPTAGYRALIERLLFCVLSYDGGEMYYKSRLDVGIIYTMNAPEQYYKTSMRPSLQGTEKAIGRLLNGRILTYASCNTIQVNDYSKYSMGAFSGKAKKDHYETQFPADLQEAFKLGAELNTRTE